MVGSSTRKTPPYLGSAVPGSSISSSSHQDHSGVNTAPAATLAVDSPSSITTKYRANNIFLSLKYPIYKDIMHSHFKRMPVKNKGWGNSTRKEEKVMTSAAFELFKKGGGQFVNMRSRAKDDYAEVDDCETLKSKYCLVFYGA